MNRARVAAVVAAAVATSVAADAGGDPPPGIRRVGKSRWRVISLAVSPDGSTVATGAFANLVEFWDPMTGRLRFSVDAHEDGTARVEYVAGMPNRLVSVGLTSGSICLWDAEEGEKLRSRVVPPIALEIGASGVELVIGRLLGVSASPHAQEVAYADAMGGVSIWNTRTASEISRVAGTDWCWSCAFSPDGKKIATAREQLLDVVSELALRDRSGDPKDWSALLAPAIKTVGVVGWVWPHLAFTPDGTAIVCGGERIELGERVRSSARICCYDAKTGAKRWSYDHEGYVRSVAVAPDSSLVAAVVDEKLCLFDAATGALKLAKLPGVTPTCAAYGPSCDRVYVGTPDGDVYACELSPAPPPAAAAKSAPGAAWRLDAGAEARCVAVSPDGASICVGRADGVASVHDAATGALVRTLERARRPLESVGFVGGGAPWLVALSREEMVRVWDVGEGVALRDFGIPRNPPPPVPPDGSGPPVPERRLRMAVSSAARRVTIAYAHGCVEWDVERGRRVVEFGPRGRCEAMAYDPYGHLVCVSSARDAQTVWRVGGGEEPAWADVCGAGDSDAAARGLCWRSIAFSPLGESVVVCAEAARPRESAGGVRLDDARTGARRWSRVLPSACREAAFSPDGGRVFVASAAGVLVLDASTGETIRTLDAGGREARSVAVSRDGRFVYAAVAGAREITRWDVSAAK